MTEPNDLRSEDEQASPTSIPTETDPLCPIRSLLGPSVPDALAASESSEVPTSAAEHPRSDPGRARGASAPGP
jgi:hypothetical protein